MALFNGSTIDTIPRVIATRPGQIGGRERLYEKEDGPADNCIVIEAREEVEHAHGIANTLGHRAHAAPNCQTAAREVLTE